MEIDVGCDLRYTLAEPTYFMFQIVAAKADDQTVKAENLAMPANELGTDYEEYSDPITGTRKIRALLGPGTVSVRYQASVLLNTDKFDPANVAEFDFANLPIDVIDYIAPSRYCPSDTFTKFAHETFGAMTRGHTRVTAVCDWVFNNIRYQAGSTGPSTNAADVFEGKDGVCRDFAHLGISLCRALGIPARYACVYADGLSPQDFHAVFQAYLSGPTGGAWYTFDPSRMSSADRVVRISAGHDAADTPFAWPQGSVEGPPPSVWAHSKGSSTTLRTNAAVAAG
jgi:transglutaminase-like putative cysteine protease